LPRGPRPASPPAPIRPAVYATGPFPGTFDGMEERPHAPDALDVADVEGFLGRGGSLALLFTAPWCAAGVLLERALNELPGRSDLLVVDCESFPHVADRFQVRSLPTLVVMRGEREQGRLLGAFSADQVTSLLERVRSRSAGPSDGGV